MKAARGYPMASGLSELMRRSLRSVAPRRAYRALADALDASYCVAKLGWSGWRQIRSIMPSHTTEKGALVELRVPSLDHPICVRAGTTDLQELVYVTIRETYGAILPDGEVHTIVDAGANIGDSSAWYLTRFPRARVIAIEPHPDNFRLLERNLRPYGDRAVAIRGALWHRLGALAVRPAADLDSTSVEETAEASDCEAVTMAEILERFRIDRVDIFKCDIEGAERDLFESDCDGWLTRTRFIAIETHGPECLSAVMTATRRHGFTHRRHRNLHFFPHRP
jgi:FkbM family methyltransferase